MNIFRTAVLAAFVLLGASSCHTTHTTDQAGQRHVIRIKGSDTEYQMVKSLAEAYMEQHPDVQIVVEGGGSNEGFRALLGREVDICNASHPIRPEDSRVAQLKGIRPNPIMFSVDAVAIITNYKLAIDSLSVTQLSQLLSGQITNWQSLGGPDVPVTVYGRNKSSGTQDYMTEKLIKNGRAPMVELKTNGDIVHRVMSDVGGIGYVGAGFLTDSSGRPNGKIWAMPVYIEGHAAYSPYESAAVKSGDYVLTRPLYQYVDGAPDEGIQDFILFELTQQGQDIVRRFGFFPLNDNQQQINRLKGLETQ